VFGEDFYFHTKAMPSRISGACNACRAKKQKVKDPLRCIDLDARSVELQISSALGLRKGNGKYSP